MAQQTATKTNGEVPNNYTLCIKGDCPKAATCLRHLAVKMMPSEVQRWSIISPATWHRQRANAPCTALPRRCSMLAASCG